MSEEILKALMQLFAIIAKQDEGVEIESNEREFVIKFLNSQLNQEAVQEYIRLFDDFADINNNKEKAGKTKLTSVKDSVKILGICKKINKTLNQEQKIIVLVRLFELINAKRKFTEQRIAIINTVAEVFKITHQEYQEIKDFVIENQPEKLDFSSNFLIINDRESSLKNAKYISTEELDGDIIILHITSVDLYFIKYTGNEELYLNGLAIGHNVYIFASGSTIKLPKGKPIYYSDVVAHHMEDITSSKISFHCKDVTYKFSNGNIGVQNIAFSENHGKLIGLMGTSGAGKTTLLNVLCGLEHPASGQVLINGFDLHKEKEKIEGVIGLVPQDDLLIEELTVFQNLYYNAKLCFKEKSDEEIEGLVNKTLDSLGLFEVRNLKVGSPIKKVISGGQRKRLNIALELVREPSILFVDEPTTGLSSRDSENVMDLLRELSLKGKLVMVVIHQPSSEIYKMFDNMLILDIGGRMIYYGNPIEAVMYFKKMDAQINSDIGECPTCGNVNPEIIFNIIEAKVVDEFGNYTDKRKVSPVKWEESFKNQIKIEEREVINDNPPKALNIPNWFKQLRLYTIRDFLSKVSNKQYILLNILEAPILGLILSYIIRYIADPESNIYIFRENDNIPIFIFMGLIVALFLGLIVSAEEIFKDRKILQREAFLNLSRSSYLLSKISILFLLSAIQAIAFVLIANNILGIKGMTFYYWFALFSTAAFANLLGLNISASFNSIVTIYIMIPFVMIPMMILSGAMFEFDKLNKNISSIGETPVIADLMPTKWSYEALMVNQFKNNKFEQKFYDVEKKISVADFKKVYYLPELEENLYNVKKEYNDKNKITNTADDLCLLNNELEKMQKAAGIPFPGLKDVVPHKADHTVLASISSYLEKLEKHYTRIFYNANRKKQQMIQYMLKINPELYDKLKNDYYNENVADHVKQIYEENKIIRYKNRLYQKSDPIFLTPIPTGKFDIRSHFYAPEKHFMGNYYETFWFNMIIIWIFTFLLYIALYFDLLKKSLSLFSMKKIIN